MGGFIYAFTYIYTNPFSCVIITMTLNTKRTLVTCFIFFVLFDFAKVQNKSKIKNFLPTN